MRITEEHLKGDPIPQSFRRCELTINRFDATKSRKSLKNMTLTAEPAYIYLAVSQAELILILIIIPGFDILKDNCYKYF